jgi:hypothetical protein
MQISGHNNALGAAQQKQANKKPVKSATYTKK